MINGVSSTPSWSYTYDTSSAEKELKELAKDPAWVQKTKESIIRTLTAHGLMDDTMEEVPNSIHRRSIEGRLNPSEIQMLNDLAKGGFWIPPGMSFREYNLRELKLAKTMTNVAEFVAIRRQQKAEDEAKIDATIAEMNAKQVATTEKESTEENDPQKPFKPIVGKSQNPHTYKNINISNEILKKLLENNFDLAKKLELLFGEDFKNQVGNVDKSLNLIV